jgi:hypothetical protein
MAKAIKKKKLRTEQLEQLEEVIVTLKDRLEEVEQGRDTLPLLESVANALYQEIDKLCKKAPAEPITDLVLEEVNNTIKETKQLAGSDPYVQRLNEFVPAGDNPQQRDVIVVLRLVQGGLERYAKDAANERAEIRSALAMADGVEIALQLYLAGHETVNEDYLEEYGAHPSNYWFSGVYPRQFNFDRLDEINIKEFFGVIK